MRAPQLSSIALAIAVAHLPSQNALAADYLVADEAQFRAAMLAASTDGDASSTIRLTANFTVDLSTSLPQPGKPVTFDTQGFTLTTTSGFGGVVVPFVTNSAAPLVFNGNYAGAAGTTPGNGLAISGSNGQVTFGGTATGGSQTGATGAGGTGIAIPINSRLINNGTVKGGTGAAGASGGVGVTLLTGASLFNSASGVITGGDVSGGVAGTGVNFNNTVNGQLVNQGTIRGGTDLSGGMGGGRAVRVVLGPVSIDNSGLIEGGRGNSAIFGQNNTRLTIVNSGGIRAGTGYANAIEAGQSATSSLTLELRAGSSIDGNVIANANGASDILRLAGTTDGVFDVSSAGDAAQYRYFDRFLKTGASTWALIGDGYLTAPWEVQQGTLQIGNGGTSGSLASNVVVDSGAVLAFNRSDISTYGGVVSGAGSLMQNGTGTTVLTGANTYTGPTTINLGTLVIDGSITSPVTVNAGGTLSGTGTVVGTLTNSGAVTPGGGARVLTIDGDYVGNAGVVRVSTVRGDDASPTGRLVITGDTSGASTIEVTNRGGLGAQTVEGIKLIDVQGASNGVFTLVGDYTYQGQPALLAGAYAYRLYQNGVTAPNDGDWYLRSSLDSPASPSQLSQPLLAPTVPLYESYASVLQRFNEIGTLEQRVGNRYWQPDAELLAEAKAGRPAIGRGAWVMVEGSDTQVDPSSSTTNADYDVQLWKFVAGFDAPVLESQAGTLVVGPTVHYGTANSSVSSMYGDGSIDVTGYGFGGAATWYGNDSTYVDGQANVSWYDSDLRSSQLGRKLENGNRGNGLAASVEVGHRLPLNAVWSVTPQAQLSWSQVRFDSFTDDYDAKVSRDNGDSVVSRLGVSLDRETRWAAGNGKTSRSHLYGITNLYYDFANGTSADVADLDVKSEEQALWAGLGVGASLNWDDDRSMLFGELLGRTSLQDFGDSHSVGAKVGVRVMW